MTQFITLSGTRYNVNHIVNYSTDDRGGSYVVLSVMTDADAVADHVRETPEQIDALLGVTDTVTALVEALQTVRIGCPTAEREAELRYGKNWRNEVIDAAIAKWRGAGA